MAAFTNLVRRLLEASSVRLIEPPTLPSPERGAVLNLLESAFEEHALDVAGPRIPFHAPTALATVEFFAWSCWFLLHRKESSGEMERCLSVLPAPRSASEHLSADLVFRFLPQIHRRARAVNPQDLLTVRLEDTLRRCPLSGVLADLLEPPAREVELAGHPGLLLLYAERLAERPRPAWFPGAAGREYVELVFTERGLPLPCGERILS
jgi:hypothetical protein